MTVLGRAVAVPVFLSHGGPWAKVAAFEGVCGVLTFAALGWESLTSNAGTSKGKKT